MTVTAYPMNASGGSPAYTARQGRQAMAALMHAGTSGPLGTRSGFRPGGFPSVSVDATTWSVGTFTGVIDAGVSSTQGPYLVAADAIESGAVTPADGTFARKDILYIQVDDTDEDASGFRRARVLYQAGVAASSPSAPSTPARSLLVGTIDVPKVGTGSPAFTGSRIFMAAAGGVVPVGPTGGPGPSQRYPGHLIYREDIDQLQVLTSSLTSRVVFDASAPALTSIETFQAANDTTAGTVYVPGTTHGTSFVAPPGGRVEVVVNGWLGSNAVAISTTSPKSYLSTYVRTGGTVGSGSDVLTPSDDRAAAYFVNATTAGFKYTWVQLSHLVTGLTPGNTYNVTSVFRDNGGGASAAVNKRRMIVKGA